MIRLFVLLVAPQLFVVFRSMRLRIVLHEAAAGALCCSVQSGVQIFVAKCFSTRGRGAEAGSAEEHGVQPANTHGCFFGFRRLMGWRCEKLGPLKALAQSAAKTCSRPGGRDLGNIANPTHIGLECQLLQSHHNVVASLQLSHSLDQVFIRASPKGS